MSGERERRAGAREPGARLGAEPGAERTPRRRYRKPTLVVYGGLAELTRLVGSFGAPDSMFLGTSDET